MSRLARSPILHFLLVGGLLYGFQSAISAPIGVAADETRANARQIAFDEEYIADLRRSFSERAGRQPDESETRRLLEVEIEEEILFREAVALGLMERDGGVQTRLIQKMLFLDNDSRLEDAPALLARAIDLGLHRDDIVVRRILVQKMRLLGSSLAQDERPGPEEIAARYREERESLRMPERRSLTHVFLSRDRRRDSLEADANAVRERLGTTTRDRSTRGVEPSSLGDPFPLGHRLDSRSEVDLARSFGESFGATVFALDPGRWSDPIRSAYGLHLVRVESVSPGRIPPLEAVADRLRLEIEERRREENLSGLLNDLRSRYEILLPEAETRG